MQRKAVITGLDQPLKIVTSELHKPPAGHIRIKTAFAGICHTDFAVNEGDIIDIRLHYGEEKFKGMVLGHEISGYIDEVGDDINLAELDLKVGDPVMVLHARGCQKCPSCKTKQPNCCHDPLNATYTVGLGPLYPGGFQTHLYLRPEFLAKVPEGMTMETAAMMSCSVGTAYGAVLKLKPAIEFGVNTEGKARIMIIGCGGLGLWAVKLGKLLFGQGITAIGVDILESKLVSAKQYGADECILWDKEKTLEENVALATKDGLVHGIIDFCGSTQTLKSSFACLQKNGYLAVVGITNAVLPINFQDVALRAITVCGVLNYTDRELFELADLVAKHKLTYDDLEFVTLDDINGVFEKIKAGKIEGRAMIKF